MKNRRIPPQDLYETVLALSTAIAQPNKLEDAEVDSSAAEEALEKLVTLFQSRQAAGKPDPFLTETLADFTEDAAESIELYRLALEQSAAFAGEPTHTKRQGIVERFVELGRTVEAREELVAARREAFAAGDTEAIKELDALVNGMAV